MKAKAVCVMRTDLRNTEGFKVPKGKLIAQGGHAFVGLLTKYMTQYKDHDFMLYDQWYFELSAGEHSPLYAWLTGKFTKIVLAVDSEEELLGIHELALHFNLNTVLITDNGETEFGKPTNTCVGIGPDWEDKIDAITGHLKGFS